MISSQSKSSRHLSLFFYDFKVTACALEARKIKTRVDFFNHNEMGGVELIYNSFKI